MEEIELFTKRELADLLKISVSQVERMMRKYNTLYDGGYIDQAKSSCPPPIYFSGGKVVRFKKVDAYELLKLKNEVDVL